MRYLAIAAIWMAAAVVPCWGALTLDFYNITNDNPVNALVGRNQLAVDVLGVADVGTDLNQFDSRSLLANEVLFQFRNVGTEASSITEIYFEDGTLFEAAEILDSNGVDFSPWAPRSSISNQSPELPGGNPYGFVPTSAFAVELAPPTQPNGVNPGEYFGLVFKLQDGLGYRDVLAALSEEHGGLRIGVYLQGFNRGGSVSFLNNPTVGGQSTPTIQHSPEAGSLAVWSFLAISSFAFVGYRRRRRAQ